MQTRTYRVTVECLGAGALVTVGRDGYRYPWHADDSLRSLARRAVMDNYRTELVQSVTVERRSVPNVLLVTAEVS